MIQNTFSYSQPEPPSPATKNELPTTRSATTRAITNRKAGRAYRPKAVLPMEPQTKMGKRPTVTPFARMVKAVTMMFTLEAVTDTTNVMMQIAKASIAAGPCTDSGAYVVQPALMPPRKKVARRQGTADTTTQKLRALSRGKAMSFAPSMIGMTKLVNGPVTMMIVAMIMHIPWMLTT